MIQYRMKWSMKTMKKKDFSNLSVTHFGSQSIAMALSFVKSEDSPVEHKSLWMPEQLKVDVPN